MERLDSKHSINKALESLPEGLDEVYARSLNEVQAEHREDAILLLQLLLYSQKPLLVSEAILAMTVDPNGPAGRCIDLDKMMSEDMKPLLPLISNLVRIVQIYTPGPKHVEIAHASVKDFLISPCNKHWQQRFQETSARADILRNSLAYLGTIGVTHEKPEKSLFEYMNQHFFPHVKFTAVQKEAHEQIIKFFSLNGFKIQGNIVSMSADKRFAGPPLYVSSALGLTWTVGQLLKNGIDANEEGGNSILTEAPAAPYYKELITKYVSEDLEVLGVYPKIDAKLGNALCAACNRCHEDVVRLLLDNGAKVKMALDLDDDFLRHAYYQDSLGIVKIVLERWPDGNVKGRHLGHVLITACRHRLRNPELIRVLLDNQADVNMYDCHYGAALHAASFEGQDATVRMLIDAGADVNAKVPERDQETALQAACIGNHKEIAEVLLQNGADPNIQDGYHGNALTWAAFKNNKGVIRLLLDYGANPDLVGDKHREAVEEVMRGMENEKKNNAALRDTSVG